MLHFEFGEDGLVVRLPSREQVENYAGKLMGAAVIAFGVPILGAFDDNIHRDRIDFGGVTGRPS